MPEEFGPLWSEIKKSYAYIRRSQRIVLVPLDFPQDLLDKILMQPFIVEVRRDRLCPDGMVLVMPAHPEDVITPPV